ncbi:DUF262 domain-containing protein [Chloroflexota bacterium]
MEIEKIKIEPGLKLGDIIRDLEKGKLRIPRFQRKFVWERPRVVRLLESMYHQFPIGSFFFWQAPRTYNKFFRNIGDLGLPEPDARDDITFILDGQQRITSLYVTVKGLTLNGVAYGEICFDMEEEEFTSRKADNKRYVTLCDMLNEERQFEIYDGLSAQYRKRFADCRTIFMTYPFSTVIVRDLELEAVCEIFERINQSGKRLSLTDLVVANTWSEDFDLREKIYELNSTLKSKGFEQLEAEAITESLSLNVKSGCTRSIQLQLDTDDIRNTWAKTVESLNLAIDYLRSNLGVKRYSFLPYRGIIPVLAYYFYKSNNRAISPTHRSVVERWFWRVSFSGRYASSTATNIGDDRKLVDQIIGNAPISIDFPVTLGENSIVGTQMRTTSAVKNAGLCLLTKREPRHFRNNTIIPLDDSYFSDFNSPEKHHIFPASMLQEQGIKEFSLANFCFIPAELNKEISNDKPSQYFKRFKEENPKFEQTMESHLIPTGADSGIWTDDYRKFVQERAELIKKEIESAILL